MPITATWISFIKTKMNIILMLIYVPLCIPHPRRSKIQPRKILSQELNQKNIILKYDLTSIFKNFNHAFLNFSILFLTFDLIYPSWCPGGQTFTSNIYRAWHVLIIIYMYMYMYAKFSQNQMKIVGGVSIVGTRLQTHGLRHTMIYMWSLLSFN